MRVHTGPIGLPDPDVEMVIFGPGLRFSPGEGLTRSLPYRTPIRPPRGGYVGLRIRKGDLVQVVTGSDRGRQGRVLSVDPKRGMVRVEKVRMQKRHLKPGRKGARTGGVIEQESAIDISNVMLVDPENGTKSRTRIEQEDGRSTRVFSKGGSRVPDPDAT